MKKSTAETIAYAIKKECQRSSLYDWCESWEITIDEFDEFLALAVDTKISVRDIRTGKYLKDKKEYGRRKIQSVYARAHKYQGGYEGNIVLMVR